MRSYQKKREENRNSIRRKQIDQYMNERRKITAQLDKQHEEFLLQGKYGAYLINDILHKSGDKDGAKQLLKIYPISSFYVFLESVYDGTLWQLSAINIISNYVYASLSSKPQECLVDKLLRILLQSTNSEVINMVLLIFSDLMEDNYKYGDYLISQKNLVGSLQTLIERFSNNRLIISYIHRAIHSMLSSVGWHQEILKLIDPLFRMIGGCPTVEVTIYIQSIYFITRFRPRLQEVRSKVYERGILKICTNVISQYHSRLTTYHYLEFIKSLKLLLKLNDLQEIISCIAVILNFDFKIGDQYGQYSMLQMKIKAYNLIKGFLRQSNEEISQKVGQLIDKYQVKRRIYIEFEQGFDMEADHKLYEQLGQIVLFFYSKCKQYQQFKTQKAKITAILLLWQGKDVGQRLMDELEIISQSLAHLSQMELEGEI